MLEMIVLLANLLILQGLLHVPPTIVSGFQSSSLSRKSKNHQYQRQQGRPLHPFGVTLFGTTRDKNCGDLDIKRKDEKYEAEEIEHLRFDHDPVDLAESEYTQVLIKEHLPCASGIRQSLEDLLGDPRQPSADRFVWDPWFVQCGEGKDGQEAPLPGDFEDWTPVNGERETAASQIQYSLTRAQCSNVFPEETFDYLVDEITELGRAIGCAAITPPWISLYQTGDCQNFHTDSTHGPMAFTFSLSKGYGKSFFGGETSKCSGLLSYCVRFFVFL